MNTWYWEGTEKINDAALGALVSETGSDELVAEVFIRGDRSLTEKTVKLVTATPEIANALKELVQRRLEVNGSLQCSDGRYQRAAEVLRKAGIDI